MRKDSEQGPQDVVFWHMDYFKLKEIKILAQEKFLPFP